MALARADHTAQLTRATLTFRPVYDIARSLAAANSETTYDCAGGCRWAPVQTRMPFCGITVSRFPPCANPLALRCYGLVLIGWFAFQ